MSDRWVQQAVAEFDGERSLLVFDYDSTIARVPIDWPRAREEFRSYLGDKMPDVELDEGMRVDEMEYRALTRNPEAKDVVFAFRVELEAAFLGDHKPVTHTIEFIRDNPAVRCCIVSNNLHRTVVGGLAELGLAERFDPIIGVDDSLAPKPQTKALDMLRARHPRVTAEGLFIGDSDTTDGEFCRRVGIPFINIRTKEIVRNDHNIHG